MVIDVGRSRVGGMQTRPAAISRIYGLGSIFGRALRDSRLSILLVGGLVGLMFLAGGSAMASAYGTPVARLQMAGYAESIPAALRGIYGNPIGVDTLGGFLGWHYAGLCGLIAGLWSIIALSGTLAGEAGRGSLEFVATAPISRRRIAVEKVMGHVAALVIAMAFVGLCLWLAGTVFATLPGDAIAPASAAGFAVWLGAMALGAGAVAFALGGVVGRAGGAGIAGALMLGGYIANGYQASVPAFGPLANASWFAWTSGHLPLAGRTDWPAIAAVLAVAMVLIVIGVETFTRADVGSFRRIASPRLPAPLLGLRGPLGRGVAERLPAGLAWGIGIGALGFMIAAASRSFADEIVKAPDIVRLVEVFFPGVDIASPGGFLQLVFAEFGFVLVGLATAWLVAGWASDESSGRLEMLLSTPLPRVRWLVHGALGGLGVIVLVTLLAAGGIGAGALAAGGDAATPVLGTLNLAVYGAALVGIGVTVGGVFRGRYAGPVVAAFAIGTLLVDILAPALDLPALVHDLALSSHLGQPMVGTWDLPGVAACLVLAVAGIAIGALGIRGRDLNR